MGSVGAVSAACESRGNRSFASADQDYQVVLPQLPTGQVVTNTIFLHADLRARPYRVENFRDALEHLGALPDVIALGAYQMNHVWAVTFKNAEAMKKMLEAGEIQVKDRRCVVVNPNDRGIRMKLHWLLYGVSEDDVRVALAPYGNVTEVTKERWRVRGITDRASTTRVVALKLKTGITVDDIPHQLRVGSELALVVVPNRAPLCLRCNCTGHIRRDCRVPRCSQCRRFGHSDTDCVMTYASITSKPKKDKEAELLMDEADAEEAARNTQDQENSKTSGHEVAQTDAWKGIFPEDDDAPRGKEDSLAEEPKTEQAPLVEEETASEAPADGQATEAMDAESAVSAKRPLEDAGNGTTKPSASSEDEPPPKAVVVRRARFKPKPSIPPDRKAGGIQPSH